VLTLYLMKPFNPTKLCLLFLLCIGINAYSQSISGIVNSYYQVTAVNAASNTVTVSNPAGLTPKARVLLIQMKGAAINGSNNSSFGNITAINNAGNYEMNTICSVSGNDVVLEFQMLNSYTPGDTVQLVTVPSYQSVTISDSVKSSPWSPTTATGGIVAIEATDTIYLNSGIDVSGQGFIGGSLFNYVQPTYNCSTIIPVTGYYFSIIGTMYQNGGQKGEGIADYIAGEEAGRGNLANGGGGGNNQNTGGGGGGNYGSGGIGGISNVSCYALAPGTGGLGLSAYGYSSGNNRIFPGGGGGSGHENNAVGLPGGNGGGIVLLSAPTIVSSGMSILANGGRPYNAALTDPYQASGDGAGGGGAGGTVIINGTISGTINISADGANGGNASYPFSPKCTGPGGGGGGGVIWVSGSSFPAAITASVMAGQNGVQSPANSATCGGYLSGAAQGTIGNAQPNYVLPASATKVCTPLPIPGLQYFTGTLTGNGALLAWLMNNTDHVASYQLQSSVDQSTYQIIASIKNEGDLKLSYMDERINEGTIYYRLMMIKDDGSVYYSQIVPLTRNSGDVIRFISLQPNPAADNLSVSLYARKAGPANVIIYNSYGQQISSNLSLINIGYNRLPLTVAGLSAGAYYFKIIAKDFEAVKAFIKR
jgi:type IX secretion system substrate protein